MIRKWMALLLSLLLVMMLPLSALADRQHTLTVVPGELIGSQQAVADLLGVLDLRLTEGDRSGALTIMLNDQDIATLGLTADTTGLYVSSNIIGADVLYVTWEDGFAFLTDQVMIRLKEQGIDQATMQAIESTLEEAKTTIVAGIGAGTAVAAQPASPATIEESMAMVEEMFPGDEQMAAYIKSIYEDVSVEDGVFPSEKRDTADQKYRMTMDEADLLTLCETDYMRNMVTEQLAAQNQQATEAEIKAAADEVMAEVKALYEESGFEMIMEMYTQDAGQTLVGMDMIMNMSLDAGEVEGEKLQTSMQMAAVYDRLTDENGVSYKATAGIAADSSKAEFSFNLNKGNNGVSEGMLGVLAEGEEIVITYEAENTAPDTRVRGAALYMRSGANAILEPAASDRPMISFVLKSEPADESVLNALDTAKPETSVNVMKLSDEAMQALGNQIMANGMQVLYTALGQLPTSVLTMVMNLNMGK